jgi:hypothetical protein
VLVNVALKTASQAARFLWALQLMFGVLLVLSSVLLGIVSSEANDIRKFFIHKNNLFTS